MLQNQVKSVNNQSANVLHCPGLHSSRAINPKSFAGLKSQSQGQFALQRNILSRLLFIFIFATLIVSCGNSKNDKLIREAEQRAHDDSVRKAAEEETKRKMELQFAYTDSVNRITNELANLDEALGDMKAEFEVQKDKLEEIKGFQFLRSRSEREAQIREKVKEINDLEKLTLSVSDKIINLQIRLDFFKSELNTLK